MNRIFGMSKAKAPKPTLDDAITSTDSRVGAVEVKIKKLDGELARYRDQMKKMRDGPGKNAVKQRALRVLQQKKMYESQRDQLMQQSFNMESAVFATENIKNTMSTMQAMQDANKAMKKQYKNVDIDKIYDMQDEMAELLEQANEVQELMGRSYNLPEDLDEQDLEAELDALGDDLEFEESDVPSYLNEAEPEMPELLPDAPDGAISQQPVPEKPAETHATAEHAMRM
ncbi:Vacuolar protein-sorting-associated protein 60 [Coemansia sp. RSA 1813]|nr:Vacuolar protein-sorting-associated protein 60 [Coemansia sp. RSA 1646]KAJ1769500.1 Vacuolar protein-sorting-associated protein 60 [Coemansia sp. RSA 1843]KAJ2087485.1 Vacuolar protein-sorting-associated protein 60 [Coemansia sp. RSA 986]KAJ2211696.1 Vacuolar protein-sorting-associated protein 60 [Coemansia sp. RSA 487]KAJ2566665.1 Vacuolar protein-sorting-associated protein 60 [Coemansia sp. RSA 1813]